jgi:hypothetical protein
VLGSAYESSTTTRTITITIWGWQNDHLAPKVDAIVLVIGFEHRWFQLRRAFRRERGRLRAWILIEIENEHDDENDNDLGVAKMVLLHLIMVGATHTPTLKASADR